MPDRSDVYDQSGRKIGEIHARPDYEGKAADGAGLALVWIILGLLLLPIGILALLIWLAVKKPNVGLPIIGGIVVVALVVAVAVETAPKNGARIATDTPHAPAVTVGSNAVIPGSAATVVSFAAPTSPPTPTSTPVSLPTATVAAFDLAGKVPHQIPGYTLQPGITVASVLGAYPEESDVYDVALQAGQSLRVTMSPMVAFVNVLQPEAKNFGDGAGGQAFLCSSQDTSCAKGFTAPKAGTYHLRIQNAKSETTRYTLRIDLG